VEDFIEDKGFVSQAELEQLMSRCSALVMPSLLGPTNLPPLDALLRGKAVVVSDAHYFDMLGDAPVFTAQAHSPEDWAQKILLALEVESFNPAELASTLEKTADEVLEKVVNVLLATASGRKEIH
jgi:glycosyltransferase involved in cell wall biosynthesis